MWQIIIRWLPTWDTRKKKIKSNELSVWSVGLGIDDEDYNLYEFIMRLTSNTYFSITSSSESFAKTSAIFT
jgi:hypothetical protein